MPDNPITVPLPQDLPTNWTYGQTIGATGSDVGLTQQHGYNYLMQQVNAAQQAAQEIGSAFEGLTANEIGAVPSSMLLPQIINVYVSKTGNDNTGDGSQGNPFLTIQKAVDTFSRIISGAVTINIGAGQYNENLSITYIPGSVRFSLTSPDGNVQIKSVTIQYCSGFVSLNGLDIYSTRDTGYHSSIYIEGCFYALLQNITCTGTSGTAPTISAVTVSYGSVAMITGSTISNKATALSCMGSIVYLTASDTGENNTVAIQCGSGYGSLGGTVFKGGSTIAGSEQTAYSGQIFD